MPMKKLLFMLSTVGAVVLVSCKKENTFDIATKWTVGDTGKMDTTLNFKPQTTGDMVLKINDYSLCPTHNISLTIKVNGSIVVQNNRSAKDTTGFKFPVKVNDAVIVQTKLIETGAKVACIALGRAECEIDE
jgi:hypothetical protein